ncbi:MAG: flippase [Candidatus Falkowbacteria bacterium]|nr:flippase [Candidatus Falkowbacteria bacterium]
MSLPKKIAYNTLIQIASKVISTILGLFALALMTRYLGQTGFGEYTTIITFLSFFAVIADLGLTLVTVQMISGAKEEENKILNNLFSLRLVSVLFFLGLAPIVTLFLPYDQTIKLGVLIAALSFVFPALNQILVGLFQKNLKMEAVSLAEVFSRLFLIIGIYISIQGKYDLKGILWATVASTLSSFLIHYFFSRRLTNLKFRIDLSLWRQIVTKTWPLAVTIAFNLIYLKADTLILSLFKSPEAVGLYGAAYKIIDVLTAVPFIFAGVILPILTADWLNKNPEHFSKVLQKSFDVMAFCAIPLVIGAQFFAKPTMLFVAGRDFVLAGPILQVLIIAIAAIFLGCIFAHAIIALDKQRKMIGIYAFTGFSSLAAYLFFIPRYSYFGAAGVTIYSEVLIALASIYYVWRYSHFLPNLKAFFKSLLAAGLMGLFLYLCPAAWMASIGNLVLMLISAVLIYLLLILFLGGFTNEDLKMIFPRSPRRHLTPYN